MNVTKLPRLLSAFSINQKNFKLQRSSVDHAKSLRLKVGSQFRVFDGENGEFLATMHNPGSGECLLDRKLRDAPLIEKKHIWLFTSALDRVRHSFLVEKAVELNVSFLFTHLVTDRTQQHGSNHKEDIQDGKFLQSSYQVVLDDTLERYYLKAPPRVRPPISAINSWIRDATQQCERLTIPSVGKSLSLKSLFEFWENDHHQFDSFKERCLLICDEDFARSDGGKGGSTILNAIAGLPDISHVGILVGPEGGFSETEKELLKSMEKQSNKRFKRVCLGPNILRVETAAIVALSQLSVYINAS